MALQLAAGAYEKLKKYQFSTIWQNNETKLNEKNMNEMRNLIQLAGDELFNNDSTTTLYHRLNRLQYETVGNSYTVTDRNTLNDEFNANIGLLNRDQQITTILFNAEVHQESKLGPEAPKVYKYNFDSDSGNVYHAMTGYKFTLPQYKYFEGSTRVSKSYNATNQVDEISSAKTIAEWNGLFNGRLEVTADHRHDLDDDCTGLLGNMVRAINQNNAVLNDQKMTYRPGAIVAHGNTGADIELLVWKQQDDSSYNFTHGNALLSPTVRIRYNDTENEDYLKADCNYNDIVPYGSDKDYSSDDTNKVERHTLKAAELAITNITNILFGNVSAFDSEGYTTPSYEVLDNIKKFESPSFVEYKHNNHVNGDKSLTSKVNDNVTDLYNYTKEYLRMLADKDPFYKAPTATFELTKTNIEVGSQPLVDYEVFKICEISLDYGKFKYAFHLDADGKTKLDVVQTNDVDTGFLFKYLRSSDSVEDITEGETTYTINPFDNDPDADEITVIAPGKNTLKTQWVYGYPSADVVPINNIGLDYDPSHWSRTVDSFKFSFDDPVVKGYFMYGYATSLDDTLEEFDVSSTADSYTGFPSIVTSKSKGLLTSCGDSNKLTPAFKVTIPQGTRSCIIYIPMSVGATEYSDFEIRDSISGQVGTLAIQDSDVVTQEFTSYRAYQFNTGSVKYKVVKVYTHVPSGMSANTLNVYLKN